MFYITFKGKYLKAGFNHKTMWTNNILNAKKFSSEESARAEKCGNESILYVVI